MSETTTEERAQWKLRAINDWANPLRYRQQMGDENDELRTRAVRAQA